MSDTVFLLLFFGVPAVIGFRLARARGKNRLLWGALSGVFPFFLVVLHFERPKDEVSGYFRKCAGCGRTFPWKHASCMYCGASVADK